MQKHEPETFCPTTRQEWRDWLEEHHDKKPAIWLVYYKKGFDLSTLTWSEAVDEALCFGWIDSTRRPVDDKTFLQFFCRRKPKSVWSKINKEKVKRLIEQELMAPAGLESIKAAKQNGSWAILNEVEEVKVPRDLAAAFKTHPGSKASFLSFSRSSRKAILQWLILAKRPETRQKRIVEIAELAAQKLKPKQFR